MNDIIIVKPKRGPLVRLADLVVNVSGELQGEFNDWPPLIQDGIMKALERHSAVKGRKYVIISSQAGWDMDTGYYVRVVAAAKMELS